MNEARRRFLLQRMAAHGDRCFDPSEGLLLLPAGGYHAAHAGHPVRESLYYALVLLELSDRSLQGRAEAIIRRVIALQEAADPGAKTCGLWPCFLEEPARTDFSRADFNGMTLLLAWHRHGRRLPASLLKEMERAIARAAICIRRGNVDTGRANIAITGLFVILAAAELTGDAELFDHAMERLGRLRDTGRADGGFAEDNGPACVAANLAGLHAIVACVRDERAREAVAPLIERFWREVAGRFRPEASEALGALIEKASRGAVVCPQAEGGEPFGALHACVVNVDALPDVVAALSACVRRSKPAAAVRSAQGRLRSKAVGSGGKP